MRSGWRVMQICDLTQVNALGDRVHSGHPEDSGVFLNKFGLYPQGCYVYEQDDCILGYLISHPWDYTDPPALNGLMTGLPLKSSVYFIHDLVMAGAGRGFSFFRSLSLQKLQSFEAVRCVTVAPKTRRLCEKIGYQPLAAPYATYGKDSAFLELRQDRQIRPLV